MQKLATSLRIYGVYKVFKTWIRSIFSTLKSVFTFKPILRILQNVTAVLEVYLNILSERLSVLVSNLSHAVSIFPIKQSFVREKWLLLTKEAINAKIVRKNQHFNSFVT